MDKLEELRTKNYLYRGGIKSLELEVMVLQKKLAEAQAQLEWVSEFPKTSFSKTAGYCESRDCVIIHEDGSRLIGKFVQTFKKELWLTVQGYEIPKEKIIYYYELPSLPQPPKDK